MDTVLNVKIVIMNIVEEYGILKIRINKKTLLKNKNVYKDENGNILDDKINLIGFWFKEKDTIGKDIISYMFFSEIKKRWKNYYQINIV